MLPEFIGLLADFVGLLACLFSLLRILGSEPGGQTVIFHPHGEIRA